MGGASSSSAQIANANITQQYSGTCKIKCNNEINGADIQTINSKVGDIRVTQTCTVNGQCLMDSSSSALADVVFKAVNSAASSLGDLGGSDTKSYQEINENIQQYVSQKCDVGSSNSMNNISIFASGSYIPGGIEIKQEGDAHGGCALSNVMKATAKATGISDNCAAAGKSAKKKGCSGKSGGIGTLILYGIIAVVLFVGIMMVVKYMKGMPDCTDELIAAKTPCKPLVDCTEALIAAKTPCKTPKPPASSPYTSSPSSVLRAAAAQPLPASPVSLPTQDLINSAVQQVMIQQAVQQALSSQQRSPSNLQVQRSAPGIVPDSDE